LYFKNVLSPDHGLGVMQRPLYIRLKIRVQIYL